MSFLGQGIFTLLILMGPFALGVPSKETLQYTIACYSSHFSRVLISVYDQKLSLFVDDIEYSQLNFVSSTHEPRFLYQRPGVIFSAPESNDLKFQVYLNSVGEGLILNPYFIATLFNCEALRPPINDPNKTNVHF